ncbi:MAG: 30S ribosome-binding factor RbfA [Sphingomonadales bacterium]|jgi:ribosome-binding factor A
MKKSESGQPSLRLLRVGESIRQVISEVLFRGDLHAPELDSLSVTVSEVRCSPDLRHATAFIMPLGGKDREESINALNRLAGPIAREVGKRVRLKYTPRLRFRLDESFDEAGHIDAILRSPKVAQDLEGDED